MTTSDLFANGFILETDNKRKKEYYKFKTNDIVDYKNEEHIVLNLGYNKCQDELYRITDVINNVVKIAKMEELKMQNDGIINKEAELLKNEVNKILNTYGLTYKKEISDYKKFVAVLFANRHKSDAVYRSLQYLTQETKGFYLKEYEKYFKYFQIELPKENESQFMNFLSLFCFFFKNSTLAFGKYKNETKNVANEYAEILQYLIKNRELYKAFMDEKELDKLISNEMPDFFRKNTGGQITKFGYEMIDIFNFHKEKVNTLSFSKCH